jgi:hypothetical protein
MVQPGEWAQAAVYLQQWMLRQEKLWTTATGQVPLRNFELEIRMAVVSTLLYFSFLEVVS